MSDHDWPSSVSMRNDGLAAGEMRAVEKTAGTALEALAGADQVQAMAFIALMRLFPEDDPGVLWEHADTVRFRVDDTPPDPTVAGA